MRANSAGLSFAIFLALGAAAAAMPQGEAPASQAAAQTHEQYVPVQPNQAKVYCSGFFTDEKIPDTSYLISGEESNVKVTFSYGNLVYINKGSSQGVREGDQYSVIRRTTEKLNVQWFKWQKKLMEAMGTHYDDLGELRVVKVQPNVSIAKVSRSCAYMQRGDIVQPFQSRPAPPFKDDAQFDIFAPVSGKPVAMVVSVETFTNGAGAGSTVFVNLGTAKGVKVGDYFRIFRYQGSRHETVYQSPGTQDTMYGFGSTPARYSWDNLPRQVLGEGIVLNTSKNSSTVYVTLSRLEIYTGDYVEVE